MPEGILDTEDEIFGGLLINRFTISLARVTQYDAENVRTFAFAIGLDDWSALSEIDLSFLTRFALHSPEGQGSGGLQVPNKTLDRLVAVGKAMIIFEVLPDPLS